MSCRKKKVAVSLAGLAFLLSVSLTGCTDGDDVPDVVEPVAPAPALRALAKAASATGTPVVLDSYTDGIKNYYLIDVGYIQNIHVSTIAEANYNGMTPVFLKHTTVNQTTITTSLTETISNSISISNTQGNTVGIGTTFGNKDGGYSINLNAQWSRSQTITVASTRSIATSVTKAEVHSQTDEFSFTIGQNKEPAGSYRYSLYGVSDIYFVVTTDLDNQDLLDLRVVGCVRDNSYFPRWDYSSEEPPVFDNSPIDGGIIFADDFYKTLPQPSERKTLPEWLGETDWETIRTDTKTITDADRYKQHYDEISFDSFKYDVYDDFGEKTANPINLIEMKRLGYKTINFYIRLDVKENDDGYQHIFLYSSPVSSNDYYIGEVKFEHKSGSKDDSWWTHFEDKLKFESISIDKFMNNEFVIRYGASGTWGDDWQNKNLKIWLVFAK